MKKPKNNPVEVVEHVDSWEVHLKTLEGFYISSGLGTPQDPAGGNWKTLLGRRTERDSRRMERVFKGLWDVCGPTLWRNPEQINTV